jgi:hypothetical protein
VFLAACAASSSSRSGTGERVDGGAFGEGFLPSGLECLHQLRAHPVGDVGVQAAHSGHLVAESLLSEDLGRAFLGHPRPVAVPEPVRS